VRTRRVTTTPCDVIVCVTPVRSRIAVPTAPTRQYKPSHSSCTSAPNTRPRWHHPRLQRQAPRWSTHAPRVPMRRWIIAAGWDMSRITVTTSIQPNDCLSWSNTTMDSWSLHRSSASLTPSLTRLVAQASDSQTALKISLDCGIYWQRFPNSNRALQIDLVNVIHTCVCYF